METTQGNSLYSYLHLKPAKTPCFFNDVLCFFFYKVGGYDRFCHEEALGTGGRGEVAGKGEGR
jgi:hypothetical protein